MCVNVKPNRSNTTPEATPRENGHWGEDGWRNPAVLNSVNRVDKPVAIQIVQKKFHIPPDLVRVRIGV